MHCTSLVLSLFVFHRAIRLSQVAAIGRSTGRHLAESHGDFESKEIIAAEKRKKKKRKKPYNFLFQK